VTKPKTQGDLTLVQAWIPKRVAVWLQREAKKKGLNVTSWLRMRLIAEMEDGGR
jgi:hypothetical protein